MTLSTYVYVLAPVDTDALWAKCQEINGSVGAVESTSDYPGREHIVWRSNEPGQGFPAWLLMQYPHDGGMVAAETHDEDCEDDCTGRYHDPAHSAVVNFDTAYGYSDEYGGCSVLHARYIVDLGKWLDAQGIDWSWRNEFTGEVHHRLDGIDEFLGNGEKAQAWFRGAALPAIHAHAAANGGELA